ncbi:MAG: hypothetical protein Q7S09_02580 [bacterium]|nr:hypothetical protein [bacterium]
MDGKVKKNEQGKPDESPMEPAVTADEQADGPPLASLAPEGGPTPVVLQEPVAAVTTTETPLPTAQTEQIQVATPPSTFLSDKDGRGSPAYSRGEMPEISAQPVEPTAPNGGIGAVIAEKPAEPVLTTQTSSQASSAPSDASSSPTPAHVAPVQNFVATLLKKANSVLHLRKQKKLEKIMALVVAKKIIGNDDIERRLHISHNTASRYLAELVKAGKLQMVGNIHQPRYRIAE